MSYHRITAAIVLELAASFATHQGQADSAFSPIRLQRVAGLDTTLDHVTALHELADGRVIVLDSIARSVSVADLSAGTVIQVAREGDGPGELRLPIRLIRLGGDTSAIVDLARPRTLLLLNERGEAVGSRSLQGTSSNPGPNLAYAGDREGRVYSLVRDGGAGRDSMIIVRWQLDPWRRDSLARLSTAPVSALPVPPGSHDPPPFTTYATWAVAPDGRIALVSAAPYRLSLIDSSGNRAVGIPVAYAPEQVTLAHREEWRHRRSRPRTRYMMEASGMVGVTAREPYVAPARWPDVLPAFVGMAARFAPDGTVWVHRAGLASAPQRIDVFGRDALLQRRLELPPHSRVVGFGAGSVYVAIRDADELEQLVRFALP